jgi:hypothetical protein
LNADVDASNFLRAVRYKGLAKNAAQVFSLIGLTNLYLERRKPIDVPCRRYVGKY